jgi:hypothetical protein
MSYSLFYTRSATCGFVSFWPTKCHSWHVFPLRVLDRILRPRGAIAGTPIPRILRSALACGSDYLHYLLPLRLADMVSTGPRHHP